MEDNKSVKGEWSSRVKSIKPIHAYEQLDLIEKATGEEKKELLIKYGSVLPLNIILSLNFDSNIVLELPSGFPNLKPSELDSSTHPDMMGTLATCILSIKKCIKQNTTLKKFKKEEAFIRVLLSCPLKDAEILCSAKDKSLVELYPSIDKDFVQSIFPSYVK